MSVASLRPNSTASLTGSVVGAASAHAATSDDSDATYVLLDPREQATVSLGDFALPAGATITAIQLSCRVAVDGEAAPLELQLVSGAKSTTTQFGVSWGSPTTVSGGQITGWTDAEIDAATLQVQHTGASGIEGGSSGALYVHELFVRVTYVARPVVVITAPASGSTLTTTNMPLISWSQTFDPDSSGGIPFQWVKVFSAAQYGAGGFDPDTATPTYVDLDNGSTGATASHQMTTPLANVTTYRAYVQVGRYGTTSSDWAYSEFTVNVALPAAPTITVTAESSSGRNKIVLASNAGSATTDALDLERSLDGGTTWLPVRNDLGLVSRVIGTSGTWYDYEAPNGVAVTYRARALHNYAGLYAASAWASNSATWSSTSWWLKSPDAPSLNRVVELVTYGDVSRAARQGSFQPLGSSLPIVVSDTRGGATGASTIRTRTTAERDGLLDIAALPSTLLLQGPLLAGEPDRYIRVGDLAVARLIENINKPLRTFTLPWTEVAQPPGVLVSSEEPVVAGALEAATSLSSSTSLSAIGA